MARKQIEGDNTPLGPDNTIGNKDAARPDQKAYKAWGVISTKHMFFAPRDKYKDIADILGLKDLDSNNDGDNDTQVDDNNIDVGAQENVNKLLIGNKSDLTEKRQVTFEEG